MMYIYFRINYNYQHLHKMLASVYIKTSCLAKLVHCCKHFDFNITHLTNELLVEEIHQHYFRAHERASI